MKELENVNLTLTPNPVEYLGIVKFAIPDFAKSSKMTVTDLSGKTILDLGNNFKIGENTIQFNTDKLTAGSYFLVLNIDGEFVNTKFNIVK